MMMSLFDQRLQTYCEIIRLSRMIRHPATTMFGVPDDFETMYKKNNTIVTVTLQVFQRARHENHCLF